MFAFAGPYGVRPTWNSSTTIEGETDVQEWYAPDTFAVARVLNVPAPRINDIVRERRSVSADTAMRLGRYFGGDARSWLNLQTAYDLRSAEITSAKRIAREISPAAA